MHGARNAATAPWMLNAHYGQPMDVQCMQPVFMGLQAQNGCFGTIKSWSHHALGGAISLQDQNGSVLELSSHGATMPSVAP